MAAGFNGVIIAPTEDKDVFLPDEERGRSIALVWAGMVLGISFLATPAKFLAPSLPLPVALDVGRQTFRIFGRVEVALAALLGLGAVAARPIQLLDLAPGAIVATQALWLRPRLNKRTQQVVAGQLVPGSSWLHSTFVSCEVVKLAALLAIGLSSAWLTTPRVERAIKDGNQSKRDG
jgi:hypothetical protein